MRRATTVALCLALVLAIAFVVGGQMDWVASAAHVGFTVMLGAGSGVVAFIVLKVSAAPKVPADKAAARDELELGVRRVVNANMHLMEACRDLADLGKRLPPEYRPIAEQTLRFAKLMEEATYAEGVSERIFPRPLFSAGEQTPVPRPIAPGPPRTMTFVDGEDPVRISRADPGESLIIGSGAMHRNQWVAGQLIAR